MRKVNSKVIYIVKRFIFQINVFLELSIHQRVLKESVSQFLQKYKAAQLFSKWIMINVSWAANNHIMNDFYRMYSQVHKYWDIDTILTFLALYTTTMDFKWNEQDVL